MKPLRTKVRGVQWHEPNLSLPRTATVGASLSGHISQTLAARLVSTTRSTPITMTDYNKWTKGDLIKRVKQLEIELKNHIPNGLSQLPPASEPLATEPQEGDAETGQPAPKKQKKAKSMDPSKYASRFIALKLAYIGKNYNGFEYQCSGRLPTIEEELWKALVKSCLIFPNPDKPNEVDWNVCEYSKCGRTDRGVSAFGQVVALRVRSNKPVRRKAAAAAAPASGDPVKTTENTAQHEKDVVIPEDVASLQNEDSHDDDDDTPLPAEQEIQYCRVINRILPPDIKAYAWCANPPPDFSARFSCRERQYRYFFTQPAFAPLPNFLEDPSAATTTTTKPKDGWLDIDAMRQAAKLFEGLHDFRNFCKIDPSKQLTNFSRRIYEADIVEVAGVDSTLPYLADPQFQDPNTPAAAAAGPAFPKVYYFHVRGSAFLWHQIRCMVAVLFLVGQGLEPPGIVAELLDAAKNPRRPNYILADDAPLVLWDCIFGRENAQGAADEVDWLYVGGKGDSLLNLHGTSGLGGDLWGYWREKKMDEILANRLLDWVGQQTAMQHVPEGWDAAERTGKMARGAKVFEGGTGPKLAGSYVPMMKKDLMQSPEEMNDRYAVRKGFTSAEEMRALGNWRDAIREAKEREAAMDTATE